MTTLKKVVPGPIIEASSTIANAFKNAMSNERFANAEHNFNNSYLTPLTTDYNSEMGTLKAALAARGLSGSSLETNAINELNSMYGNAQDKAHNYFDNWQANQTAMLNSMQNKFQNALTEKNAKLLAAKGVQAAQNRRAVNPSYSPIGDIFKNFVGTLSNAGVAQPSSLGAVPVGNDLTLASSNPFAAQQQQQPRLNSQNISLARTGAPSGTVIG